MKIIILDFGSQYTHLIKLQLSLLGFTSEIFPGDIKVSSIKDIKDYSGIILSGGAYSVKDNKIDFDKSWLKLGVPVLGICYGHQLIINSRNGQVKKTSSEFSRTKIKIFKKSSLFKGVDKSINVWMSHQDSVVKLPKGYNELASSQNSVLAAYEDPIKNIYGVQFHPEVSHTEQGDLILMNFAHNICKMKKGPKWTAKDFFKSKSIEIKEFTKNNKIVFGLSGGVDSLTMAVLLRKSLDRSKLLAVYVDSGLMPINTILEVKSFCKDFDIPLLTVDKSNDFFSALKGIVTPREKGMIIGEKFIRIFEKIAKEEKADIFAQGTIWSDVIESGVTKFSSQIKPHHNVAGLPNKMSFKLLEPLRELFKSQVRDLAKYLDLPKWAVEKKVFPGPGFAIRVDGEVTREKVNIVRRSTEIVEEIISKSNISNKIWMAFTILIEVPSLGVKGDERVENKNAIVIRVVESKNSMTAEFSKLVFPYLAEISKRIIEEVGAGRVVYDITNKPPATIEWQ